VPRQLYQGEIRALPRALSSYVHTLIRLLDVRVQGHFSVFTVFPFFDSLFPFFRADTLRKGPNPVRCFAVNLVSKPQFVWIYYFIISSSSFLLLFFIIDKENACSCLLPVHACPCLFMPVMAVYACSCLTVFMPVHACSCLHEQCLKRHCSCLPELFLN